MHQTIEPITFLATAPRGTESLLKEELRTLGAGAIRPGQSGVGFGGTMETAYRVCLWSRVANRVLLPVARFRASSPEELYERIRGFSWEDHVRPDGTIAVDFGARDSAITHSHFGALKVKDAIVDRFRAGQGLRPSIDTETPDLRINVTGFRNRFRVSIDLSGTSLHRRGYREHGAEAPLKENLAAAILLLADWPAIAASGGPLLDPMCGSGTLPIEAALMAADIAPGLSAQHWGFARWLGHDESLWAQLVGEASERRRKGMEKVPPILGCDASSRAVAIARENVVRAGIPEIVEIRRMDLSRQKAHGTGLAGLFVVNPPYGERLGDETALGPLYEQIGVTIREQFPGWRAALFTGNPELGHHVGLAPFRVATLYNGPIRCTLSLYETSPPGKDAVPSVSGGEDEMLRNRIRKNLKRLRAWTRREGITSYRVYDADIPEFAFAVDLYRGAETWLHVQEYRAPETVDPASVELRRQKALAAIPAAFDLPRSQVFFKVRRRQRGCSQYERFDTKGRFMEVSEGGLRFLVNLADYLDTGLFLDHRPTRAMIREMVRDRTFLNLFGYTATATVYAAAGGARTTTTVDLSNTYLDWARRNMELNGFTGPEHRFVRADCFQWVTERTLEPRPPAYDLIFLDPPTFSTSKGMEQTLDVRRDHVDLIRSTARLLAPGGTLIFSTNARKFRLNEAGLTGLHIEDITGKTIPPDFARRQRIHRCWIIRHA